VAAIRIPEEIYRAVMLQVVVEDLDFSKFARRAIKRELAQAGVDAPDR